MMYANEAECRAAGIDPEHVERIARRINRAAKEARALGLEVFGGSTAGSLRTIEATADGQLIVAEMSGGVWSGGDGAIHIDDNGLARGEY